MAKASDLNVRLGLIFDEKALGQAERSLRRAGDRLTKVGNEMMTGLTLPLGLFGASAIKAAGDLESLTKALQTQSGSAAAASQELQKLTELARNPGLGIEETIRASVRLQSVGIEADKARGIIKELGNAIAASGNGAQEFDSVVKQFAQMISKGKILQEDISVISESLPMISQLMEKAFGTSSVEMLRQNNVSVEEFIGKITQAASELPRFESGIKNNISNALDEMRISLGKVGLAIENSFNVSGNLSAFAEWLSGLAATFSNLNPAVQSAILYFGAFLVAIGPIAKTIGNIQLVSSVLTGVWAKLLPKVQDLTKWLGLQRAAFLALTPATQAFVAIGLAVAIGTMAYNMGLFNRELTASEKALAKVNELTQQAKSDTAGERAQVEALIGILSSETQSRENKIAALEKLKQINPEYFGQLNIEQISVDKLRAAYEGYADSIVVAARAKRAEGELVRLDEELQKAIQKKEQAQKAYNYMVSVGRAQSDQASELAAANAQVDAIQKQFDAVKGLVNANVQSQVQSQAASESQKRYSEESIKASKEAEQQLKAQQAAAKKMSDTYKEVFSDIQKIRDTQIQLNSRDVVEEAQAIESGIKRLLDAGFTPTSEGVQKLRSELKGLVNNELAQANALFGGNFTPLPTLPTPTGVTSLSTSAPDLSGLTVQAGDQYQSFAERLGAINTQMKEGVLSFGDAFQQTFSAVIESGNGMQNAFFAVADALSQTAADGSSSLKEFAAAAVGAAAKVIRAQIQEAVAGSIATALAKSGIPFPYNIAAGAAAGAAASGLFNKLLSSIKVPGFARGTRYAPGGLALVGEQGPELMNVPRGSQILSNNRTNRALEGINSQANISGEFTVRGTDLVLVLEKAQSKQKRIF